MDAYKPFSVKLAQVSQDLQSSPQSPKSLFAGLKPRDITRIFGLSVYSSN